MSESSRRRARRRERRYRGWGFERKHIRRTLIQRDGNICQLCWEPMEVKDMTLDHIIPSSRGGSDDITNLQLAHNWCNNEKGDKIL